MRLLDPNPKNPAVEDIYLGVGDKLKEQLRLWGLINGAGGVNGEAALPKGV